MSDNWEGAVGRCAKCTEGSGKVQGERSSRSLETKRALAFLTKTAEGVEQKLEDNRLDGEWELRKWTRVDHSLLET